METLRCVKDYETFCEWIKNKLESSEIKSCYDIKTFEYLDTLKENGFENDQIRMILGFMDRYLMDYTNNPNKSEVQRYRMYKKAMFSGITI